MLDDKLDNREIRKRIFGYKFSSGFKPTEDLIKSILDRFWFHDFYNSFISDEANLDTLLEYLDKEHSKTFNRYDYYKFFFDKVAPAKARRSQLQLLALKFEQFQSDRVQYAKFTKLLRSNNLSILAFPFFLKTQGLGKVELVDNEKLFVWSHHTLTEFLVVEYLLNQKKSLEEFQKLAILEKDGITAFKPSWSGVLRFLFESTKGLAFYEWFIDFLENNPDNIDDNLSELLVFVDVKITPKLRKKVFYLIYISYFSRLVWLPTWTSSGISKFVSKDEYVFLKKHIKKWPDETETFVKRGNIISIVEGLIEDQSPLITSKEKAFWKDKLVEFANDDNENGVLQRHSLSALAKYKDESLIKKVGKNFKSRDSLIRDEFLQFCIDTNPNSKESIQFFIQGIPSIYARYGLFKITKKESLKFFLKEVSRDELFWTVFLDHASIYDKENGDQQIVDNLKKVLDNQIVDLLKKIIFKIFQAKDIYQEEKFNFIKQVVFLINDKDKNFIFEILGKIKSLKDDTESLHLFFDYEEIIALLLTPENMEEYIKKTKSLPERHISSPIYIAKRVNGSIGQAVYEKAVRLKLVEPVSEEIVNAHWKKEQDDRKQKTVDRFLNAIEPEPDKYSLAVFENYLQNKKDLDEFFKTKDGRKAKQRLIDLAVNKSINKINPREIKVSIPNKDNRQFTWSSVASYYGKVLSIVKIFAPKEIKKHRQQIIDFIPYAFSDDMNLITDFIEKVNDKELEFVNNVMENEKDDRRYLIPGTYIYLVSHYAKKGCNLPNTLPVLESFIGDKHIADYNQEAAIEAISLFTDSADNKTKKFLEYVFEDESENGQKTKLAESANAVLIKIFNDNEAINWRFERIKKPIKFDKRRIEGIAHSVGPEERELDSLTFANLLLELRDEKYLDKFFGLLEYSFEVLKVKKSEQEKKEYWEYINYLWRIVMAYVENLKENKSFKTYLKLEGWASKHSEYENSNWLMARIRELKKTYIDYVGRIEI